MYICRYSNAVCMHIQGVSKTATSASAMARSARLSVLKNRQTRATQPYLQLKSPFRTQPYNAAQSMFLSLCTILPQTGSLFLWRACHMGVFKRLIMTSWTLFITDKSQCKTFIVTGDVGELAALCVKGKQEHLAPRLYAHERIRKLSEIDVSVSVITVQLHGRTELKHVAKG